jgi:hypothetical protein
MEEKRSGRRVLMMKLISRWLLQLHFDRTLWVTNRIHFSIVLTREIEGGIFIFQLLSLMDGRILQVIDSHFPSVPPGIFGTD